MLRMGMRHTKNDVLMREDIMANTNTYWQMITMNNLAVAVVILSSDPLI